MLEIIVLSKAYIIQSCIRLLKLCTLAKLDFA